MVLNIYKQLGGAEIAVGRKSLVHAVGIVACIGVLDAYAYGQSSLAGIGILGDGLRRQRVTGDFALDRQVGIARIRGLQAGISRNISGEFVLSGLL